MTPAEVAFNKAIKSVIFSLTIEMGITIPKKDARKRMKIAPIRREALELNMTLFYLFDDTAIYKILEVKDG